MARLSLRILNNLRDGDQLVTRGCGMVSSVIAGWTQAITLFSGWRYPAVSHTAALMRHPAYGWCVYESSTQVTMPDMIDGVVRRGVQAHRLEDYARAYPGKIWLVRLREPLPNEIAYREYLLRRHADQITYDWRGALGAATPLRNDIVPDTETNQPLFCTAYYLYALRHGGVFPPPNLNPREYHPRQAMKLPWFHDPIPLKE